MWRPECEQGQRTHHDRRNRSRRAGPVSHGRHAQRDHGRQQELEGKERAELVDGGVAGPADQRRAKATVGKEITHRDHGESERDPAEGGRRKQVRQHQHADERDHLGSGGADRQQDRADCAAFPDPRWAFRLGWPL